MDGAFGDLVENDLIDCPTYQIGINCRIIKNYPHKKPLFHVENKGF